MAERVSGRLFAVLLSAALLGAAAPVAKPLPLLVDGKAINPICLYNLDWVEAKPSDPVDIRHCKANDIVIQDNKPDEGMIGFSYKDKDSSFSLSEPYFYYEYLGKYDGDALIYVEWDGGGSGHFTQLATVRVKGNSISVSQSIAGGDRCNGGMSSPLLEDGKLTYDQDITPIDLIDLAKPGTKLDAYKGLESSARSCVATVHNDASGWTSVTLSAPDWADRSGWTEQFKYQSCFNGLYHSYIVRKETELDRAGVAAFAKAFMDSCMKKS